MPFIPGDPDKLETELREKSREKGFGMTVTPALHLPIATPDRVAHSPVGIRKMKRIKKQELIEESFITPGTWTIPVATYSVANTREMIGRSGSQQDKVFAVLGKYHSFIATFADFGIHTNIWQVKITMTRLAPRELDVCDNLPCALKACIDAVARMLGVRDNDKRVRFVADQEKSDKYGVRVKMEVE